MNKIIAAICFCSVFIFIVSCERPDLTEDLRKSYREEENSYYYSDDDADDDEIEEDSDSAQDEEITDDDQGNHSKVEEEKCIKAGGTWDGTEKICTRTATCDDKPANSEWNGDSSYTQQYNNFLGWSSPISTKCSEKEGTCHFKCEDGYWCNGSECLLNPCNLDPCTGITNSTDICTPLSETDYECGCINGYFWNGTECLSPCNLNPCTGITNSTDICTALSETDYECGCIDGYFWNGFECAIFPECSKTSATPCKDHTSSLVWSLKASDVMTWQDAVDYCGTLTEGEYDDWHLPNIDELRTLLIADRVKNSCKVSEANNCLTSYSSCWSCSTCTQAGIQSSSGTECEVWGDYYDDGRYSKFGETGDFWSSSAVSNDKDRAWYVNFFSGSLYNKDKTSNNYVRCVRYDGPTSEECDSLGGTWNASLSKCTRTADCQEPLPGNAVWNSVTTITQTWNGIGWYPSTTAGYNTEPSDNECSFKCESESNDEEAEAVWDWEYNSCRDWWCVPYCNGATICSNEHPCDSVENSDGNCIVLDSPGDYECGCINGYYWNNGVCDPTAETECIEDGGNWDGSECNLPLDPILDPAIE